MGGPDTPIVPTLSYWDNDIQIFHGEEHLKVVLIRETAVLEEPPLPAATQPFWLITQVTTGSCLCFLKRPAKSNGMIRIILLRRLVPLNPGYS